MFKLERGSTSPPRGHSVAVTPVQDAGLEGGGPTSRQAGSRVRRRALGVHPARQRCGLPREKCQLWERKHQATYSQGTAELTP